MTEVATDRRAFVLQQEGRLDPMATVVLTGFMGTGKTVVGRELARRLGRPFVDTDALIEKRECRSVAEIFAAEGEAYFRSLERDAVEEALAVPGAVIATGGGTIVNPENLRRLRSGAPVVCLTARPDVIVTRVRGEKGVRPLLEGEDPAARVERLLVERASAYRHCDLMLDTSDCSVSELVDEILSFLGCGKQ